jgi:hypothetical protein
MIENTVRGRSGIPLCGLVRDGPALDIPGEGDYCIMCVIGQFRIVCDVF